MVQVGLGGGQYLAVTVRPRQGPSGTFGPTAELRLITRNLGAVPDEVEDLAARISVWNGPAFYPAFVSESP